MTSNLGQPTTAEVIEDRKAQCEKIAALFKAHPLYEIEPEELHKITPHYQQRISELRRLKVGRMNIINVSRSLVQADGTKKKRDGAYRYEPHDRLGRDAGEQVPAPWNQDRPFAQPFELKP